MLFNITYLIGSMIWEEIIRVLALGLLQAHF